MVDLQWVKTLILLRSSDIAILCFPTRPTITNHTLPFGKA